MNIYFDFQISSNEIIFHAQTRICDGFYSILCLLWFRDFYRFSWYCSIIYAYKKKCIVKYNFLGPPITSTTEVDALSLLNDNSSKKADSLPTGPFTMRTPAMTTYNQQLWVIAKLSTGNTDGK